MWGEGAEEERPFRAVRRRASGRVPMKFAMAERLQKLPPYLFAEIDTKKARRGQRGGPDRLGIGDPDMPTPPHIVEALKHAADTRPTTATRTTRAAELPGGARSGTRSASGSPSTPRRGADADRLEGRHRPPAGRLRRPRRHGPGPGPRLPGLRVGTLFAGGEVHSCRSGARTASSPTWTPSPTRSRTAKLMWINYPNNPTARPRDLAVLRESSPSPPTTSSSATTPLRRDLLRRAAAVFLECRAQEVGIEFHSLSKTYNMTGWRVGFCRRQRELSPASAR